MMVLETALDVTALGITALDLKVEVLPERSVSTLMTS
jgi:hypothetical protein